MQIVINNYGQDDLSWLPQGEVTVYDHKKKNFGYNIFDYMDWIVKNYDKLDDIVLFTKGNMLKRHITPEEWDKLKDNKTFTPLLTQGHKVDGVINYYDKGLYYEKNDGWYFNHFEHKFYDNYKDFSKDMGLPNPQYLGFAPGACYLVPRENIVKHPKEFYNKLKEMVEYTQLPAEAHMIERSIYNIWS